MDSESKPMLHVSQQFSPADQEQSIVSSDIDMTEISVTV